MAKSRSSREGSTHKALSVVLRIGQLACAAIVLGVLGEFTHRARNNMDTVDNRIIYAMALAGICIVYALVCLLPTKLQFLAFPMDMIFFVMWLTAFCLLETRTGTHTCSSSWYQTYWAPNWVGIRPRPFRPVGVVRISNGGCAYWQTALGFAFLAVIVHMLSAALGVYVWRAYGSKRSGSSQDSNAHVEKLPRRSDNTDSRQPSVATDAGAGGQSAV